METKQNMSVIHSGCDRARESKMIFRKTMKAEQKMAKVLFVTLLSSLFLWKHGRSGAFGSLCQMSALKMLAKVIANIRC